jgi:hypothetical protein
LGEEAGWMVGWMDGWLDDHAIDTAMGLSLIWSGSFLRDVMSSFRKRTISVRNQPKQTQPDR